jgi:hypothetical protein
MVRLRDFEVPIGDGEVTVPWVHVPVAPSVVQLLGRRTVIVDPARAPNGVRPCTVIDPSPDAEWVEQPGDSSDDDSLERVRRTRPRHAAPTPLQPHSPVDRGGAAGTGDAEANDATYIGCVRCGECGHAAASCPEFRSDRGASHRQPGLADIGAPSSVCSVRATAPAHAGAGLPQDCVFAALTVALQAAVPDAPAVTRDSIRAWLSKPRSPSTDVQGRTLAEWIKLDSEHAWTAKQYLTRFNRGCWGGLLEIAMCSVSCEALIDVWRESSQGRLVLVAEFGAEEDRDSRSRKARPVLNLLHMHGRRYAALVGLLARRRTRK